MLTLPILPVNGQHLEDLRKSGLSNDTIREAGLRTITDWNEVARLLNWKGGADKLGDCLAFPFFDRSGRQLDYVRVKPSTPRISKPDEKGNTKPIKYESPVGESNRIYLPKLARERLARQPSKILITEGEKKALKACQEGYPCIGLVGVAGWSAKREDKTKPRKLCPDLATIQWQGWTVYIVFDSDAITNKNIQREERLLADALTAQGAIVNVVRLPNGDDGSKVGLDDYLVSHPGKALFDGPITAAESFPSPGSRSKIAVPTSSRFRVGDKVSPIDRDNVGEVTEVLPNGRYNVHFMGKDGEADVSFPEAELRPWPPRPDDTAPTGGKVIVPEYQPFPVAALPNGVREFVLSVASAVGCDPCMVALPTLALVGAAVGGALTARPKRGWNELPVLYAAVVGDSGTAKSPAADAVAHIAHEIENQLTEDFNEALFRFRDDIEAFKTWKADHPDGPAEGETAPEKPTPPVREYFVADDVTIERLIENLQTSPRGIIVVQDELANWFGSLSRYKGKNGGNDSPKWLSMYEGKRVGYQRRTSQPGTPRDVTVKRGIVSVSGGIQPGILADALSNPQYIASGLAARMIFAYPPKRCVRWNENEPDQNAEARYRNIILALRALPYDPRSNPPYVRLETEALAHWADYHDENAEDAEGMDGGPMSAALPKLSRMGLRLALIHHCVTEADAERDPGKSSIPVSSVIAGIELAKWCRSENERIYAMLAEKPEDRAARSLVDLVKRKGGRITPRDLQRSNKSKYPMAAEAELALQALVTAGIGRWEERTTSGRTAKEFILVSIPQADSRQKPTEEGEPSEATTGTQADKSPTLDTKTEENPEENEHLSAFVGCRLDDTQPIPTDEDSDITSTLLSVASPEINEVEPSADLPRESLFNLYQRQQLPD